MPIDFSALADNSQQSLLNTVQGQGSGLEDQLAKIAAKTRGSRQDFINQQNPMIASTLAKYGINQLGRGAYNQVDPLEQSLQTGLNQARFNMRGKNISLGLDTNNKLSDQAQQTLFQRRGFSQDQAAQTQAENFAAKQAQSERDAQVQMDSLKDYYVGQGLFIQDQYQNQNNNYEMALARAFGGLAGNLGGLYLQKQALNKVNTTPSMPNPYASGGNIQNV